MPVHMCASEAFWSYGKPAEVLGRETMPGEPARMAPTWRLSVLRCMMGNCAVCARPLAAMMSETTPAAGSVCPRKPLLAIKATGAVRCVLLKTVEIAPSSMGSPSGVPATQSEVNLCTG